MIDLIDNYRKLGFFEHDGKTQLCRLIGIRCDKNKLYYIMKHRWGKYYVHIDDVTFI